MRYFLISERTPSEIRAALSRFGECVALPPYEALAFPVSHHPDMLMASLDGTLFVHRGYGEGQEILSGLGASFVVSEGEVGEIYPHDVALNCFLVGELLFGRAGAVSKTVLSWAREAGKRFVPVKQGYARCSTVIAGGALASADRGIVRAAAENGIPALLLPAVHIDIERYDTGFLGGASVQLDEGTLGFFGQIEAHPAYERLRDFFGAVGVSLVSLSGAPLFDHGGAITLERG